MIGAIVILHIEPIVNFTVVTQFYSGLSQIVRKNEWTHSGSPAYYNFILKLDSSKEFSYQLILLSTSKGDIEIQYFKLKNLRQPVIVVPYYSLFMSCNFLIIKKIENFYNKIMQYIAVIRLTKSTRYYYIDRDNILLVYLILHIKKARVIIRLLGVTEGFYQYLTTRVNIFSKIIKWVFNHSNVIFICTNDGSYAEVIKDQYKDKFHLLFNGVDANLKKNPQLGNKLKLVYLSRIAYNKGHEDFINGIARSNFANKLDVKIIGSGILKDDMKVLSLNSNLNECINFMGRLDHLVAVDELSKADLVISINYDGVYGNVVLEASSMGIPVVVLEHPGCQTQGLYGLLGLKRGDRLVGNIAKIIRNAVNNEVWLSDIGKNSEQFSLKHLSSWDQRIESEMLIIKGFFN